MKKALGWLFLAVFSFGFALDLARGLRIVLGACGLVLGTLGFAASALGQSSGPTRADVLGPQRPDPALHETLVAESFYRLSPMEAATVVGILHHFCITPSYRGSEVDPLELHAAVDLVARATGLPKAALRRLYHDHWIVLREAQAPRLCRKLTEHKLAHDLYPYREVE